MSVELFAIALPSTECATPASAKSNTSDKWRNIWNDDSCHTVDEALPRHVGRIVSGTVITSKQVRIPPARSVRHLLRIYIYVFICNI